MLKVETTVPRLRPRYANEREVIGLMTGRLAARIKARTQAGRGVDGALPAPKDGGRAYNRSGTLTAAIAHVLRWKARAGAQKALGVGPVTERDGVWEGVVRAFGDRPTDEAQKVTTAKRGARQRQAQLRAAAVLGGFLQHANEPSSVMGRKRRGTGVSLARVRVRAVTDNASLAAVLSVRPRDRRSINGDRGEYRVFEAREDEHEEVAGIARDTLVVELVDVGGSGA